MPLQHAANKISIHESFSVGALLALAGGFLDAYTYLSRGGVFANAQTGNMVLLGVRLAERDWSGAVRYLIPILAFAAGVLLAEWIQFVLKHQRIVHWRQVVLLIEILLLCAIGFVPDGDWNPYVNIAVSFVCALQVEAFRTMHGLSYATTMCTGNLRSGTECIFRYFQTKDRSLLSSGMKYYAIILIFILGAVLGVFLTGWIAERAVWVPGGMLVIAFLLLFQRSPESLESITDQR
ncbi:MAG: YoaK family protein [Clostridiaceae bacterium]